MTTNSEQIDWGHWILRLVALIIDGILLAIAAVIIAVILALALVVTGGLGFFFAGAGFFGGFGFLWGILAVLYYMIFDTYWGATIGKKAMGLQVQMVNGNKVTFDKAFIRNISKIYPLILLIDWIVGIATTGDKRQKFSDRIAGTIVVQTKQPFAAAAPPPPPPPPPPT
jgi:uncharacterized RDD family membrane protein YckC